MLLSSLSHALTDYESVLYGEYGGGGGFEQKAYPSVLGVEPGKYTLISGAGTFLVGWRVGYNHLFIGTRLGLGQIGETNFTQGYSVSYQDVSFGFGYEWNIPMMTTLEIVRREITGLSQVKSKIDGQSFDASGAIGTGYRIGLAYFLKEDFKLILQYSTIYYGSGSTAFGVPGIYFGVGIPFNINYPSEWWRAK
jgi:hypothetical protein